MIVGLTGGIGSGKSTVARLFALLSYPVFNSDVEAKLVYFIPQVKTKVISLLGCEAYTSETVINKAYISSRIFSNAYLRQQLNNIIHPVVKTRFTEYLNKHNNRIIIKESALLFEAGLDQDVDRIILVCSPDELRINRVMQRDNSSREEVIKKMQSQLLQEEKIKKAHFVINNNEQEFVIEQVLQIQNRL